MYHKNLILLKKKGCPPFSAPQPINPMVSNPCPCSDGIFSCPKSEPIFRFGLNAFCKVGILDDAEIAFANMGRMIDGKPSVAIYNILINGYARRREHEKAMAVYEKMIKDRVKPDVFIINTLIRSCRNSLSGLALEMFKEMKDKGRSPNVFSFHTLIKGSFRERKFEEGTGMAYEMLELGC